MTFFTEPRGILSARSLMQWITRLFNSKEKDGPSSPSPVFLTNTLSGKKELFVPLKPGVVSMYTCGPTVYGEQHIGNMRPPLVADTLARMFKGAGFHVRRVINITDVGHLTDGGDQGEDKMALGAAKAKTSPEKIAERYTKMYLDDLADLNVDIDDIRFPRATDYIREQIALAKTLEEKGFAYKLPDGLYFDTSRFPGYGKLGNLAGASLKEGARVASVAGKRHPMDFALWRTAKPHDLQKWDSPWGEGNPGWHIECSAMIRTLLGPEIDIHTGGEDLATIHHNDEIAQSEAAGSRQFVRYWLHNAFLNLEGEKISKSLGNVVYLSDITGKGFHPLALRYLFLQAHYRTPISFSWNALEAAAGALSRLWRLAVEVAEESGREPASSEACVRFLAAMRDDIATPQALGILWEALRSEEYTPEEKWGLIETAEEHFALNLTAPTQTSLSEEDLPADIKEKLQEREEARKNKDFAKADRLREELAKSGYHVEDGPEGTILTR